MMVNNKTMSINILEKCRMLIGKNQIKKAIDLLETNFKDSDYSDEILQHKNKLTNLESQERIGILSFNEANITRNRIVHALLSLISGIKETELIPKEEKPNSTAPIQVINIINSKNVNTGNVNTGGGHFNIGDR